MKKIYTIIGLCLLGVLIVYLLSLQESKDIVSEDQIKETTISFINTELLGGTATASLISILKESNVYKLKIDIEGQEIDTYVSLDGKLFFPEGIKIEFAEDQGIEEVEEKEIPNLPLVEDKVIIYHFWGDGCPYCTKQKPYIEKWNNLANVQVIDYEVYNIPENQAIFQSMRSAYNVQSSGVPMTFIGEKHWVGFAESMVPAMEEKINQCLETGCINPGDMISL
ncbi:MAG: glutaredoxin domain-containing protein [Candidatus Pacebacteria bacterium]|nr:glutaredoxin domain-containing protein [Candidatus Paceibacterota bacterium]